MVLFARKFSVAAPALLQILLFNALNLSGFLLLNRIQPSHQFNTTLSRKLSRQLHLSFSTHSTSTESTVCIQSTCFSQVNIVLKTCLLHILDVG